MNKSIAFLAFAAWLPLAALAQAPDDAGVCTTEWNQLASIGNQIKATMQKASDDATAVGDKGKKEHDSCLEGTFKWEEIHWALDVPQVTMRDQKMSLDIPQVTLKQQEMSWDFPASICEERCDGPSIPVIICSGLFNCRTENRPTCYPSCRIENRTEKVIMGLPEVTMATQAIVLALPEVTLSRIDMKFHSLSWYTDKFCVNSETCAEICKPIAEKTGNEQQAIFANAKDKSNTAYAAAYNTAADCTSTYLMTQRRMVEAQFDAAVSSTQASIQANPDKEQLVAKLSSQLVDLQQKRAAALAEIDAAIEKLKAGAPVI